MEDQPQSAKRRRRPSVRLGEIGYAAPYDASSLWIEAPRQRKKQQAASAEVLSTGKPGVKPPRIRPLEHLAAETAVIEEEWGVIEPTGVASGDEQKLVEDSEPRPPVKEQQQGKRRSSFTPRKGNGKPRGKGPGGGRLGWTSKEASRPEPPPDADSPRDDDEEEKDYEDDEEEKESPPEEAPISAETSSDSEELLGSELKGEEEDLPADDSGNGASDGSEDGDPGANPNSHGDEMQGAIEDGPGQVNGKSFVARKQRQGERRSGRQAASRVKTNRDTPIRDRDIASRDVAIKDSGIAIRDSVSREIAGEPSSGRFQTVVANGTTIVTPNSSSQRGMLSTGVSGWLQDLGLGKYSELFELNEVDTEVLPLLTFEDLREMGVDAVGARRKMFHGIQELGQIRGI